MAFADIQNALTISDERIGSNDLLVLVVLAHHKNSESGLCCPAYERLAKITRLSRATVSRSIQRLKELGFITIVHNGRSNRYELNLPAGASDVLTDSDSSEEFSDDVDSFNDNKYGRF